MAIRGTGRQVTLDMLKELKERRDRVAAQLQEVDEQLEKAGVNVGRSHVDVAEDFMRDLYKSGGRFTYLEKDPYRNL